MDSNTETEKSRDIDSVIKTENNIKIDKQTEMKETNPQRQNERERETE